VGDVPSLPTPLHVPVAYLSGWPRRVAAVLCLLLALGTAVTRTGSARAATVPIVVAGHSLTAGALLGQHDLSVAAWPAASVPVGTTHGISGVVGRRTATSLGRGMPVTTAALLEPAIATALTAGQAASTVDLASQSQLAILRTGDRVDLYASPDAAQFGSSPPAGTTGAPVARGAQVLSILTPSDAAPDVKPALVVATDRAAAAQLAQIPGSFLATLVQPP
jgi:pilus assembly protein CpaB